MNRIEIPFDELNLDVFKVWKDQLLLTAGENEPGKFNSMTIGWGGFGYMWHQPIILVVVRPTRYTYEFIEKSDSFTVCAFDPKYNEALKIMGTKSGRDVDKVKEAKLTPVASVKVAAPGFAEAKLTYECKKVYFDDFKMDFAGPLVKNAYSQGAIHRFYIGQVVAVYGNPSY